MQAFINLCPDMLMVLTSPTRSIGWPGLSCRFNLSKPVLSCVFNNLAYRIAYHCPRQRALCHLRQSDVDMWAALEAVQMKDYVLALPGGLDAPVAEGGGNLSVSRRRKHSWFCVDLAVLAKTTSIGDAPFSVTNVTAVTVSFCVVHAMPIEKYSRFVLVSRLSSPLS